jgi:hypothetical protein
MNRLGNTSTDTKVYKSSKFKYNKIPENIRYVPTITQVYDKQMQRQPPKVVVFDLDETIGCFTDLYLIWKTIFTKDIYRGNDDRTTTQKIFNDLLDLYPEFLRYGILHILEFIKTKIQTGESHRIYLYTNNQCDFSVWTKMALPNPTEWVEMIIVYLNMKLNAKDTIFAKPICAFKINNQIIEPLRKNTSKTHFDFLKCSILPKTTEICFIDNTFYDKMCHDKVYYIQPPPYIHSLKQSDIINRFVHSALHSQLVQTVEYQYNTFLKEFPSVQCASPLNINNVNHETYMKMMYYIKEFFCMTTQILHTRKRNIRIGKFSRKKYNK